MKLFRFAAALALALYLAAVSAHAAPETIVAIPYGAWVHDSLGIVRDVAIAALPLVIAWLGRELPAYAVFIFKSKIAEQWLTKALDGAINQVDGAARGRELKLDVGTAVLARALNDMVQHAPRWLLEWLGGPDGLRQRLLARLHLESAAAL